jgi:hypothetical protein
LVVFLVLLSKQPPLLHWTVQATAAAVIPVVLLQQHGTSVMSSADEPLLLFPAAASC